jgi:hypothetical protein
MMRLESVGGYGMIERVTHTPLWDKPLPETPVMESSVICLPLEPLWKDTPPIPVRSHLRPTFRFNEVGTR